MAVGIVSSASSGSQASVATFNIGTLGTGARAGIVFVCIHNSATDIITGVTWNSSAMTLLYKATDTDTEPGVTKAYFLNNVTNGVITVSRTNNTVVTVGYAASISADKDCAAYQTITRVSSTQNTNADTSTTGTGASGAIAVDDGSPGTSSMRFAAAYTGAATPLAANSSNSTGLQSLDSTAYGSSFVRETTAGQGSRSVGFATGTTDDYAAVFVAVREIPPILVQPAAATITIGTATPAVVAQNYVLIQPAAAAVSIATATPAVATPTSIAPAAAAVAVGTATPTVVAQNYILLQPAAASVAIGTATPAVVAQNYILLQPAAAAISISAATPAVGTPVSVAPAAAAVSVAGATPAVLLPVAVAPAAAAVGIAGATPAVATPVVVLPAAATVAIAGSTPAIVAQANQLVEPAAAAVTIGAATPTVVVQNYQIVQPAAASISIIGATPAVAAVADVLIQPSAAGLTFIGATPAVDNGATPPERPSGSGRGPWRPRPASANVAADDDDILSILFAA